MHPPPHISFSRSKNVKRLTLNNITLTTRIHSCTLRNVSCMDNILFPGYNIYTFIFPSFFEFPDLFFTCTVCRCRAPECARYTWSSPKLTKQWLHVVPLRVALLIIVQWWWGLSIPWSSSSACTTCCRCMSVLFLYVCVCFVCDGHGCTYLFLSRCLRSFVWFTKRSWAIIWAVMKRSSERLYHFAMCFFKLLAFGIIC